MSNLYLQALGELKNLFARLDQQGVDQAVQVIAKARKIALYGVGREGLQIKGFAMRLFHLGLQVSVVGDMTVPPLGEGDLLIVSAGPGSFSTVNGLIGEAQKAGAEVLCVTAQVSGASAKLADHVLILPAQTMADDQVDDARQATQLSVLPMGSLYEGAQYILFEVMILKLKEALNISSEFMRSNHTNLE